MRLVATFDAGFFAAPASNASASKIKAYLEALDQWTELYYRFNFLDTVEIWNRTGLADDLYSAKCFPDFDQLRRMAAKAGVSNINVQAISRFISNIVMTAPVFEQKTGINDFLTQGDMQVQPDLLQSCETLKQREILERSLVSLTILECKCPASVPRPILAIYDSKSQGQAKVKVNLEIIESEDKAIAGQGETLSGPVQVCGCWWGLLRNLGSPAAVLASSGMAEDSTGLRLAILAAMCSTGETETDLRQFSEFEFNKKFAESLRRVGGGNVLNKVFRRMVDVLLWRYQRGEPHWIREGKGAEEAQRRRMDGSLAWKWDIDRDRHLLVWLKNGSIEFAKVTTNEPDNDIPN